jgi:hypothetical protein
MAGFPVHEHIQNNKHQCRCDTVLMQENWKIKDGKVTASDQYTAKIR